MRTGTTTFPLLVLGFLVCSPRAAIAKKTAPEIQILRPGKDGEVKLGDLLEISWRIKNLPKKEEEWILEICSNRVADNMGTGTIYSAPLTAEGSFTWLVSTATGQLAYPYHDENLSLGLEFYAFPKKERDNESMQMLRAGKAAFEEGFVVKRGPSFKIPLPRDQSTASAKFGVSFKGTIGKAVVSEAVFLRDGTHLIGQLRYKRGSGEMFVSGTFDPIRNTLTLDEFDPSKHLTGKFTGKFVRPNRIEGEFEKPGGAHKMKFALEEGY